MIQYSAIVYANGIITLLDHLVELSSFLSTISPSCLAMNFPESLSSSLSL